MLCLFLFDYFFVVYDDVWLVFFNFEIVGENCSVVFCYMFDVIGEDEI